MQLKKRKQSFERPAFYLEAAEQTGKSVIFFSLTDINWRKKIVRGWDGIHSSIMRRDLPDVIINRTRTTDGYTKKWIKRLKGMGKLVINEKNVVSKLKIHDVLSKHEALLPYLPQTENVNYASVKNLLEHNNSLYLKPRHASVGNGIIRIHKKLDHTIAEINVLGRTRRTKVGVHKIIRMVRKQKREYLVQQGIPLMSYKDRGVDFRVSVQKDGSGSWQCTGIVGRVAKKGAVVTNIHCGGQSMKASELFQAWNWNESKVKQGIEELGVRIAEALEKELPPIADLGLDIALDEHQHPWLIEVNFRDLRITFRDAGEKDIWRSTFANPIYYAAYLIDQGNEQLVEQVNLL